MPGFEDEPLGAFGSAAQIPSDTWFPVNAQTGQWGSPAPTLASAAGVPDVGPAPLGTPDQAPLAMGQVAGGVAPQMTMPASMRRVQRLDAMGGLTPQRGMWEEIARSVGMLSPQGRTILQASDQQQQQQLQNRLTMRRQMLQEDQEARAATQEGYRTLVAISQIKNKALRNMQFERFAAQAAEAGQPLPADFIETYKKSTLAEGEGIAQAYGPLLEKAGFNREQTARILESGDLDTIKGLLEGGLKVRKQAMEEEEQTRFGQIMGGGTGTVGAASGQAAPAPAPGTPWTGTPATGGAARQPVAAPSKDIADAIDESARLYPQVRKELITAIASRESNFDPTATSPKGAQGVMQLMPGTAKEMGVEDSTDVKQNVRGGTRYFAQLLTKYKGNEALALAAYNAGPGRVDAAGGDLSKLPAETQAYVPAVLQLASGGGAQARAVPDTRMMVAGPGAPAPVRGTAQDNTARVSLDQEIAANEQKLQGLAGLTSDRANKAHDNLSKRQDVLIKRRDRIEDRLTEGPRALEKQQLLQQGELEKAREAERVRADNERASQQEIDAINRLLPADKKLPYGTTRAEIRQRGLVGASELPQTVMEGFTDRATVVRQLGGLQTRLGDLPVGPWSGRVEAFRQATGIDVKDEAVAFRTLLAGVHNQLSLTRGGKALTPQEVTRIEKELPTERDPFPVFREKLKTATKIAEDIYRLKAQFYRKAGYGVPDDLMSPWETAGVESKEGKGLLEDMTRGK